jgi:hypothetical protein
MSDTLNFCKRAAFMVATAKSISDKTKTIGQLKIEGKKVNSVRTQVLGRGGSAGARTLVYVEFDPTVSLAEIEAIVANQPGVEPDKILGVTLEDCNKEFEITDSNGKLTHKLTMSTGCVDHDSNSLVILSYANSLKFDEKIYIQVEEDAVNNVAGFVSYGSNSHA